MKRKGTLDMEWHDYGAGRPSSYHPGKVPKLTYMLALLGLTNPEIAMVLGIGEVTFNRWMHRYTKFRKALWRGRQQADAKVVKSLFKRACGYSHPDVHISSYEGQITVTPIVKHYPPDVGAITMWLHNRQRGVWESPAQKHEVTGPGGGPLQVASFDLTQFVGQLTSEELKMVKHIGLLGTGRADELGSQEDGGV